MTTRLTRVQACAALAKRVWPEADTDESGFGGVDIRIYDKPNETHSRYEWNPFTDRDAAAELATWIKTKTQAPREGDYLDVTFIRELRIVLFRDAKVERADHCDLDS